MFFVIFFFAVVIRFFGEIVVVWFGVEKVLDEYWVLKGIFLSYRVELEDGGFVCRGYIEGFGW